MMSDNDRALIRGFLEDLVERMGRAGCNDYELPDTPENRKLVVTAYAEASDWHLHRVDGKIRCADFMIVHELIRRLT